MARQYRLQHRSARSFPSTGGKAPLVRGRWRTPAGKGLVAAGYSLQRQHHAGLHHRQRRTRLHLDPSVGEFLLTHPNIRIPETNLQRQPGVWSSWTTGVQRFTRYLQGLEGGGRSLSLRYIGTLIGDFHRDLLAGRLLLSSRFEGHQTARKTASVV